MATTADAGGTWQGTLTVVGNGEDPGSVSAQGWDDEMRYCAYGQPVGTARVAANTPGSVTVTVSPSSTECFSHQLPTGTYDIRWVRGTWDPDEPYKNECGGTADIGDITVTSGSGGPVVSEAFDPGSPGTIQVCVTSANLTFGVQSPSRSWRRRQRPRQRSPRQPSNAWIRTEPDGQAVGEDRAAPKEYVFYPNRISESTLFKIPETDRAEVLCVEGILGREDEFKAVVEDAG